MLRHRVRHVGRLRRAGGAARPGRPRRVVAGPLRLVLRHPRRDPAALGRRDRLRRRADLDQWREALVRADDRRLLRDPEQPDAGARRHRGRDASWPTPPAPRSSSTTSSARRSSPSRSTSAPTSSSTRRRSTSTARAAPSAAPCSARGVHRRAGAEPHAAHRTVDVARSTRGCSVKGLETLSLRVERMADSALRGGALPRVAPAGHAGRAPLPRVPPAARARQASDARRRHRRDVRARRRQGRGLRG